MFWLVAKIDTGSPYPCRCDDELSIHFGRHSCGESMWGNEPSPFGSACACWGRVDLTGVPAWCCGRRKIWPEAGACLMSEKSTTVPSHARSKPPTRHR